jgi:hypothetical protein
LPSAFDRLQNQPCENRLRVTSDLYVRVHPFFQDQILYRDQVFSTNVRYQLLEILYLASSHQLVFDKIIDRIDHSTILGGISNEDSVVQST